MLFRTSFAYPGDDTFSEDGKAEGRNLEYTPTFKFEGGLKTYPTFKSCTPADLRKDKFTVLQFEVCKRLFYLCYSCNEIVLQYVQCH